MPKRLWSIKPEDHRPALARNRFNPVPLFSGGSLRPEIDINRPIGIHLGIRIGAGSGLPLTGLKHGLGGRIVHNYGPEILVRTPIRHSQFVGLASVKRSTGLVQMGVEILRS